MKWNTTPPPKDGAPFLADVGWPYIVVAAWNETNSSYAFANYCADNVQIEVNAPITNDVWFETEHTDIIKAWMPMPEVGE